MRRQAILVNANAASVTPISGAAVRQKLPFAYHDLGQVKAGSIVEVTLSGHAPNVRLLDHTNFNNFKAGKKHRFIGGQAKKSPVHFKIPRSGHWYVTVDMIGLRGKVSSSARILPGPLPPLRQSQTVRSPLAPLVQNTIVGDNGSIEVIPKDYDVFISHATEDKDAVARPLAHALRERGLTVWYDEFELRIGHNLRQKIDQGLANSRFGVVILSPSFFNKNWPLYELDGLVSREMTGEQLILPLWHNLTRLELMKISPSLTVKLARSTSDYTIEEIANEIATVIREALGEVDEGNEWEEEHEEHDG